MLYHQFLGFCRRKTRSPWCLSSVHIFNLPSFSFSFHWNSFKRLFVCCFARHLFTWAFRHVVFARVARVSQSNISFPVLAQSGQSDCVPPLSPPYPGDHLRVKLKRQKAWYVNVYRINVTPLARYRYPRLPFQDNKITKWFDHWEIGSVPHQFNTLHVPFFIFPGSVCYTNVLSPVLVNRG